MAKKPFNAPDLTNATPTMLVDELAKLSLIENHVKKMRAFYKEALYARVGIDIDTVSFEEPTTTEGERFLATTTKTAPRRIDTTALKEAHPEIAEEFTKANPQLTTRFQLMEGQVSPVVNALIEQMKMELDLDD